MKHLSPNGPAVTAENLRVIDAHGYIAHVVNPDREAEAKRRHPGKKAHRWVGEVCRGGFNRLRKLLVRYERLERSVVAFKDLAAAIMAFRPAAAKLQ